MYSAQRVSARNANIYLPFDRQFADGGVQVTGNCGGKAPRPQYCTMGDGVTPATFPAQLDTRRGVSFPTVSVYASMPAVFVDEAPFSIATLLGNILAKSGTLVSTLHPVTGVGVTLSVTQRSIDISLGDGVTIVSASCDVVAAGVDDAQQRGVVVAYDGSGTAMGLTLFLDGKLLPWTSASGSVAGSVVSGLDAVIGASWLSVAPDPVTVDNVLEDGIIHTLALYPFALTEHMAGILDARMRAEIHVLEDAKYTPV